MNRQADQGARGVVQPILLSSAYFYRVKLLWYATYVSGGEHLRSYILIAFLSFFVNFFGVFMKKNLPFSYRLIAIRKGNQITQVEMARKLGIARQTYLDLETGKTEPRISILYKIAEIFNIPVSAFFENEQSVSSFISLKKSTDAQLIAELECRLANRRKQKDKE